MFLRFFFCFFFLLSLKKFSCLFVFAGQPSVSSRTMFYLENIPYHTKPDHPLQACLTCGQDEPVMLLQALHSCPRLCLLREGN